MSENHPRPAASLTVRTVDGTTVVTLCGELDLLAAVPLRARLDALTREPHPDLVLDLRPATFIDCSGLGVLCRARNRVGARCGRLRLVTDGRVLRIIRAAGLDGVFELHPRLPDSLTAPPAVGVLPPATA
ncbi:STAS domain-containing protein [Streptomyces sp. NPDC021562]|uniref:STAS domain-containing protein n=1 Tax=Streptomyces sp. NPDC021562 TaxID=3155121 RepID=UPI00104E4B0F